MNMKTITLINLPWFFVHEKDIILSQNLGLGYLTSFLMKNGHKVNVIDALAEGGANCKKMRLIDKTVKPFYLRFYHRNYFYIKKDRPV